MNLKTILSNWVVFALALGCFLVLLLLEVLEIQLPLHPSLFLYPVVLLILGLLAYANTHCNQADIPSPPVSQTRFWDSSDLSKADNRELSRLMGELATILRSNKQSENIPTANMRFLCQCRQLDAVDSKAQFVSVLQSALTDWFACPRKNDSAELFHLSAKAGLFVSKCRF